MSKPFLDALMWSARTVEPVKRMVGGKFGYAVHRFPIKGGICFQEAVLNSIQPTETPFMARFLKKR